VESSLLLLMPHSVRGILSREEEWRLFSVVARTPFSRKPQVYFASIPLLHPSLLFQGRSLKKPADSMPKRPPNCRSPFNVIFS